MTTSKRTLKVEGDLRQEVQADIRRKIEITSTGLRYRRVAAPRYAPDPKPPRTRKGPKRNIAGKKKAR